MLVERKEKRKHRRTSDSLAHQQRTAPHLCPERGRGPGVLGRPRAEPAVSRRDCRHGRRQIPRAEPADEGMNNLPSLKPGQLASPWAKSKENIRHLRPVQPPDRLLDRAGVRRRQRPRNGRAPRRPPHHLRHRAGGTHPSRDRSLQHRPTGIRSHGVPLLRSRAFHRSHQLFHG